MQIALVSGAAQGIGRDYACALAARGLSVVVADINLEGARDTVGIIERRGGSAWAAHVDIADPASARSLAEAVRERHGALHILVNNAAFFQGMQFTTPMTCDIGYWRKVFSINLDGCLIMSQALAPLIVESGGGRIVNQSSTAAYGESGDVYCVAKTALNALTVGLAQELGSQGVTVNAIAPGPIPTEAMKGHVDDDMLAHLVSRMAVQRPGDTNDLIHALLYLIDEKADWVTGQILVVDGGGTSRVAF